MEQARQFLLRDYLPKIERCLEQLSDAQIWWRANEESNSIGNLLLHLSGNVRQWIVCGLGGRVDRRQRDSEFAQRDEIPRHELLSLVRETLSEADQVLAEFDSSALLEEKQIQGTRATALEAIFHVTEHFSMHTGQIILLTKMQANKNLRFYDFASGAPVHNWNENIE